jgi:uncharacterized protein YndB with AHSA1/START domain
MITKTFTISINAPKEKVWNVLWNDDTYRKWTSAFSEGSHAEGEWKKGSEIKFLNAEKNGMYSRVDIVEPHETMIFEHLGVIKKGEKQPVDDETKKWTGSKERYFLKGDQNKTELSVEIDIVEEFTSYFEQTFPKALQLVKELAEHNA